MAFEFAGIIGSRESPPALIETIARAVSGHAFPAPRVDLPNGDYFVIAIRPDAISRYGRAVHIEGRWRAHPFCIRDQNGDGALSDGDEGYILGSAATMIGHRDLTPIDDAQYAAILQWVHEALARRS